MTKAEILMQAVRSLPGLTNLNPSRINHFRTICANRTKIVQTAPEWSRNVVYLHLSLPPGTYTDINHRRCRCPNGFKGRYRMVARSEHQPNAQPVNRRVVGSGPALRSQSFQPLTEPFFPQLKLLAFDSSPGIGFRLAGIARVRELTASITRLWV